MMRKGQVGLLVLVATLVLLPTLTQAQAISGRVVDATGGALPGTTVTASSPALIEKSRTVVTDGQGLYNIEALLPGVYTVTFGLSGFSSVVRDGVELRTGFTA